MTFAALRRNPAGIALGGERRAGIVLPQHFAATTARGKMTRTITDHQINPANDKLTITVIDEPGSDGANHLYQIEGFDSASNPSDPFKARYGESAKHSTVLFQNGPIAEVGVNGVTHEAMLAILIDRMRSFQAGPYACRENALALTKMEEAQHWLLHRTRARMARGVEGTHEK